VRHDGARPAREPRSHHHEEAAMTDQDTITTMQVDVAQAANYTYQASELQTATGDPVLMTFAWQASVTPPGSTNPGITVTASYGGGTYTNNVQTAFIPWGYTNSYPMTGGGAMSVNGQVAAIYTTDGSAIITFIGNMILPSVNNIIATPAIVAACIAQS
jgi:hypothetical protein